MTGYDACTKEDGLIADSELELVIGRDIVMEYGIVYNVKNRKRMSGVSNFHKLLPMPLYLTIFIV